MQCYKSTEPPRIVLIDASADSNALFTILMSVSGISVQAFISPEEALLSIPAIAPDVIVLSIVLKGLSGFQVCRRLRRMQEIKGSSIVALTGLRYPGIEDICLDAGFDHTMPKPVSRDMVERIVQLASTRRAERDRRQETEAFSTAF
jgi:putative two-component system response regulator